MARPGSQAAPGDAAVPRAAATEPRGAAARPRAAATKPRAAATRRRAPATGQPGAASPPPALIRAIADYLLHLQVERGLAAATVRAYRSDLADFASSVAPGMAWDRDAAVPLEYLARRTDRGRPDQPHLRPSSLRRRAAAIRGFYRFAFGEGLIPVDVAQQLDLPRQSRLLPETLTQAETERLLEAVEPGEPPDPTLIRDRALLELLYAAGLRVSEALGLDREDLSLDGAFVRVIGKGDRERLVPVGEIALEWLDRYLTNVRPAWLAVAHVVAAAWRSGVPDGARRSPGPPAGVGDGPSRGRGGGPRRSGQSPHPAPFLRHASPRGRGRPAHRPGVARACEYQHDPAVHPPHGGADPRGLRESPPAGLREVSEPMDYVDGLLSDGEQIVVRERQHWIAIVLHSRWAVLLLVVALVILYLRIDPNGQVGNLLTDGGFGLIVAGLLWIGWGWLKWHNQSYLVTNRRVLKIEGLFNKHTADSSLEKINDAELDQNVFGRMLNFGDLDILTAAETEVDRFRMLRDPVHFKIEMMNQKHELEFEAMRPPVSPPLRSQPPTAMTPTMAGAGAMAATPAMAGDPAVDAPPAGAAPAAPVAPPAPAKRDMSPDEVTRTLAGLADLRDRGAISAEEYEAKKADLLGRI